MNYVIAIIALCFAFCFLLEGIYDGFEKRFNKVYKVTHILYPLFIVLAMLYFLSVELFW